MKFAASLLRRFNWLNFSTATLIALLQRTPILRVVATAEKFSLRAPAASILKAACATTASLGAVHALAGATALSPTTPNPASTTVGVATLIAFTVRGAETPPASFTVGGNVPPGLTFAPLGSSAGGITSGNINGSTIQLSGTPTAAGSFTLSIRGWEGANGTLTSALFSYTINVAAAANTAPVFTTQPSSQSGPVGGVIIFSAAAAGSPTPTYKWFKNGAALSTQTSTSSSLILQNLTAADAGSYTCVATNSISTATSNAATLTVTGGNPPIISTPPSSAIAALGGSTTFTVVAQSASTYQWRKNSATITGATGSSLTLNALTNADAADYDVVATNSGGSTTSATATLLVSSGLTSRLSNVSVRTTLAANQILIVGLTMQGGAKPALIRAAGPSLGALGIPGTMANPRLTIFNGSAPEATNDDWGGDATVASTISAVGAFPLVATTSLDAALVRSIDGGRTVQVSGPAAGNLIVEAYDAASGLSPRLTNLSARNFVGTGGDVLIAGFTVAGSGNKNVLIRAAGPSLGALGVAGTLVDPKLELFNSSQVKISENDNYSPTLPAVSSSVGAFPFVPGAKDAALMVSLPPGGYTVQVSGADGGTGDAIVEVYELP